MAAPARLNSARRQAAASMVIPGGDRLLDLLRGVATGFIGFRG